MFISIPVSPIIVSLFVVGHIVLDLIIPLKLGCIYYNSRNIAVVKGINHNSLNAPKLVLTILLLYVFKMNVIVILDFSLAKTSICDFQKENKYIHFSARLLYLISQKTLNLVLQNVCTFIRLLYFYMLNIYMVF